MPHKQKENHDHSTKSKRELIKKKQERDAKRKAQQEARLKAELEALAKAPNNIALAEGAGAYVVGCEEEEEFQVKFNLNKRNKKHLRRDVRRKEQERLQREREQQEEQERLLLQREEQGEEEEESEEEEEEEEYLVYICECCGKKYATTNAFANHANSRKHQQAAALFEQAGIIVTSVQLRLDHEDEFVQYMDQEYDDFEYCDHEEIEDEIEDQDEYYNEYNEDEEKYDINGQDEESDEDEEEEEEILPKTKKGVNLFSALMDDDDDDDDESSTSDNSDQESDREDESKPPKPVVTVQQEQAEDEDEDHTTDLLLEEMIQKNRLEENFNEMDNNNNEQTNTKQEPTPIPFHHDYNPDLLTAAENRLASVQHRLQKQLAAKGIEPNRQVRVGSTCRYAASDAVTIGHTLLQQLMEANKDQLQNRLEAYNQHKKECQLLTTQFALAKGNSKALPAQYAYKPGAADDSRKRANVHHAGSHYHMQAARSMQFGRTKGLMARHSSQGARLQAKRMADKETARMQSGGGGMKVGKTSKKSQMKRLGEAGASKKTGGTESEK